MSADAVKVNFVTDENEAAKEAEKLEQKYAKIERRLHSLSQENRRLKRANDRTMASAQTMTGELITKIGALAGGYVGLSTVVSTVTQALGYMHQQSEEARQSLMSLADARRNLTQVAGGDSEWLEKLSDARAARHGVERTVAAQFTFDAQSLEFDEHADRLLSFSRVVSPHASSTAAGKVPKLFDKEINSLEAANMIYAVATSEGSELNFEGLTNVLPVAAQGGSMAGSTPAETMALAGALTGKTAGGEQASALIRAFGTKVSLDEDLRDEGGIVAAYTKLANEYTEEQRRAFLGQSQELNVAYELIGREMETIGKFAANAERARQTAGTAQSPLAIAQAGLSENTKAEIRTSRARIAKEIATEVAHGIAAANAEAVKLETLTRMEEENVGSTTQMFAEKAAYFGGESEEAVGGIMSGVEIVGRRAESLPSAAGAGAALAGWLSPWTVIGDRPPARVPSRSASRPVFNPPSAVEPIEREPMVATIPEPNPVGRFLDSVLNKFDSAAAELQLRAHEE